MVYWLEVVVVMNEPEYLRAGIMPKDGYLQKYSQYDSSLYLIDKSQLFGTTSQISAD
jgi:hypothetical protein